jgi:2-oxoglutarate dehydrogenase E2 component (dihydrolipoamide succinyltransferase)
MGLLIKVPPVGESITEVTLVKWLKKDGDWVNRDEMIAELESEKATFEINAEQAGKLKIIAAEGATLKIGDITCELDTTATPPETTASAPEKAETAPPEPVKVVAAAAEPVIQKETDTKITPVAAAIAADKKVDTASVTPSGAFGKILKEDVLHALENPGVAPGITQYNRTDKREAMSRLRKTVSRRLVEAKNTTAMLTTFNEVDMTRILEVRTKYKDLFKEKHKAGLGFMGFFTKACCYALQEWPSVNAYIDGDEIIYHSYCDISIAVSAPKGLVVPVIRNAESMSMAEIELKVAELAGKARDNKLSLEEMQGGTFTLTNGGVFGSLMSTPIINIPQSAILGMHKIEERPIAINGQVVVRSMMYLALSYDHRIIDGRESVSFLVRVKELLESPEKLLFGGDPVKALLQL